MSMSTFTTTKTFTITEARYITSKIKTDLKLLQGAYGSPSDARIEDFGEEAAMLLAKGYLDTVTYGFKRDGDWVVALRYVAHNGTLIRDDRAGRIERGVDVTGASWSSYLTHSLAWDRLSAAEQEQVESTLPISRTGSPEPSAAPGYYWDADRSYSKDGTGVARSTLRQL